MGSILGVLIEHAVEICQSVTNMLENQGKADIAREEDIRSQVFDIVNKQQPKVNKAIIQSGYFRRAIDHDQLFPTALQKICDNTAELFSNTISHIDGGRYFDCK